MLVPMLAPCSRLWIRGLTSPPQSMTSYSCPCGICQKLQIASQGLLLLAMGLSAENLSMCNTVEFFTFTLWQGLNLHVLN
ncbi:hypothetical protein XELAEV_18011696mg [Xenopus laevis]|uniref:Uncharacterized protein n=1 Tax=Xenopus laevis TaxID=8355 RepID=A0A974DLC7_XENLA|nr:hypothetical protein XELAEV_18011696mg [Xenopus laevis]